LDHPNAAGKVFNISDGEFHSLTEIIKTICQSIGRRPPGFSLPIGLVRPVVGILEDLATFCSLESSVTRSSIDKYTEDIAVESKRIQTELGFIPKYDLSAGWADTIKELRTVRS
jgi:UDP-glucose 4-epimerase